MAVIAGLGSWNEAMFIDLTVVSLQKRASDTVRDNLWVIMAQAHRFRSPQISCSNTVTILLCFYSNKKQFINQGTF